MKNIRGKVSAEAIPGIPRTKEEILNGIIKDVWGVSFDDMKAKNRHATVLLPRQLCMTTLYLHGYSNTKAAEPFNKDHATTINAKKRIAELIETKHPRHDYDRVVRTFERYKEHFEDFNLSELQRIRDYNYHGK